MKRRRSALLIVVTTILWALTWGAVLAGFWPAPLVVLVVSWSGFGVAALGVARDVKAVVGWLRRRIGHPATTVEDGGR